MRDATHERSSQLAEDSMRSWFACMRLAWLCLALALSATTGCRTFQEHPWTTEQASLMRADRDAGVEYVSPSCLMRVRPECHATAIQLLESASAVRLTVEQLQTLVTVDDRDHPGKTPYLLRGVTWQMPPMYTIVYWRSDGTSLCVEQYSYNGEIYIPGNYKSVAHPVVAFLERSPTLVAPRAISGGDGVIRGMSMPYAWREEASPATQPTKKE